MPVGLSPMNNGAACDALYDRLKGDYQTVHVRSLTIPEGRLRKIDPKSIPGLADSIREVGQIAPIGVKRIGTSQYRVVYGARRVLAMTQLLDEAMKNATDPNKDPAVYKYSNMHVLLYRDAIDDETCQELEARENLDRQELMPKERVAHTLLVGAFIKRRHERDKQVNVKASKVKLGKGDKPVSKPVRYETAEALGIPIPSVEGRMRTARRLTGNPNLDLDASSPEELENAAQKIHDAPQETRSHETPSKGIEYPNGIVRLNCQVPVNDAPKFAIWIRKRYPASFSLDQIRAFRDALAALVTELEQADTGC